MLFGNVDPSPGAYYSGLSKMLPSYDKFNLSTQLIQRLHQIEGQTKLNLPPRQAPPHFNSKAICDFNEQPPQRSLMNVVGDNQYQGTINDYFNSARPAHHYNTDERVFSHQTKAVYPSNGVTSVHRKIRKCFSNENHPTFNLDAALHGPSGGGTLLPQQQQPLPPRVQSQSIPFNPQLQPLLAAAPSVSSNSGTTSRYKTELCRPFEESGECKYGDKCQFAHGIAEMRNLSRHPKYKTELCRTFHSIGFCPYGPRCHFIHNKEEAGTLVLEDDDIVLPRNDGGILKFYQNQQHRHQSLPTNNLLNSAGPLCYPPPPNNLHNYSGNVVGLPPHKQQLPSLLSNGSFSMSSSQLYDSIQNSIAIVAASAAIKSNSGNNIGNNGIYHTALESRKSLPTILPSTLMPPPPQQQDQACDLDGLVSTMRYLNLQQQPLVPTVQKKKTSPPPPVSSTSNYDEHQGSAYDSGIEDSSSVYTTLFNSILRKQQISSNNSSDPTPKHYNNMGVNKNGTSSPDSNFSGNSDGANDLDYAETHQQIHRSNCSMTLLNPRLPIFKSFSTEGY